MIVQSWHIAVGALGFTLFMTAITIIGNYIGSKVSVKKDLTSHDKRLNSHSKDIKKNEDDINDRIKETQFLLWRQEFRDDIKHVENTVTTTTGEIKTAVADLGKKLDKHIMNGRK